MTDASYRSRAESTSLRSDSHFEKSCLKASVPLSTALHSCCSGVAPPSAVPGEPRSSRDSDSRAPCSSFAYCSRSRCASCPWLGLRRGLCRRPPGCRSPCPVPGARPSLWRQLRAPGVRADRGGRASRAPDRARATTPRHQPRRRPVDRRSGRGPAQSAVRPPPLPAEARAWRRVRPRPPRRSRRASAWPSHACGRRSAGGQSLCCRGRLPFFADVLAETACRAPASCSAVRCSASTRSASLSFSPGEPPPGIGVRRDRCPSSSRAASPAMRRCSSAICCASRRSFPGGALLRLRVVAAHLLFELPEAGRRALAPIRGGRRRLSLQLRRSASHLLGRVAHRAAPGLTRLRRCATLRLGRPAGPSGASAPRPAGEAPPAPASVFRAAASAPPRTARRWRARAAAGSTLPAGGQDRGCGRARSRFPAGRRASRSASASRSWCAAAAAAPCRRAPRGPGPAGRAHPSRRPACCATSRRRTSACACSRPWSAAISCGSASLVRRPSN